MALVCLFTIKISMIVDHQTIKISRCRLVCKISVYSEKEEIV